MCFVGGTSFTGLTLRGLSPTALWNWDRMMGKVFPHADDRFLILSDRWCVYVCALYNVCVLKRGSCEVFKCVYRSSIWSRCSKSAQMESRCAFSLSGEFCQAHARYNWSFAFSLYTHSHMHQETYTHKSFLTCVNFLNYSPKVKHV